MSWGLVGVWCLSFVGSCVALGAGGPRDPPRPVGASGSSGSLGRLVARARGALERLPALRRARASGGRRELVEACERQMPELLDILGLGLSAGLSFDASLELYCARRDTELAREMRDALRAWQMGLGGRAQALEGMAARVGSPSVRRFADAVQEAIAFGAPLAATLERQADSLREEQRAATQQRVEEAPVRMLIPLGTLVVPAMLLAILGPLLSAAFGR